MQTPPLLSEVILGRVLRLASFDGLGVLISAGLFALLSAAAGDYGGAAIGILVAGAGAIELHGVALLRAVHVEGMNWLIGSQAFLMASMLGYCVFRLTHVTIPPMPPNLSSMIELTAEQLGMTKDEYLHFVYRAGFQVIAGLTVIYQGSMALYYIHRRAPVAAALTQLARTEWEET